MNTREYIINLHKNIHQNILRMVPEKFRKICLYASIVDENKDVNGEMFFYYFPKGLIKRKPINVYEIPELFSIEDEQYSKLEKELYESIKKISKYHKSKQKEPWTNITIIIEGTKYRVEFNYDDLLKSEFTNYERHIIWRYKNLGLAMESFTKNERDIIFKYLNSSEYYNNKCLVFEYNFYEQNTTIAMQFNAEEKDENKIEKSKEKTEKSKEKIEKNKTKIEKKTKIKQLPEKKQEYIEKNEKIEKEEKSTEKCARNQLLNF